MTDTVCVPVEPTEAMLDAACYHGPDTPAGRFDYSDARTVWSAMLAASPQGEGSSADPAPIKPSGDTGEQRDRVARIIDPSAFLFSRDELDAKVRHHPHDAAYALADAILDLIRKD